MQIQAEDIKSSLPYIKLEYEELLNRQVNSLFEPKIEDFLRKWKDILSRIYRLSYHLLEHEEDKRKLQIFTTVLLLYSLLIDADKRDAAKVSKVERKEIPDDLVDKYRDNSNEIDASATTGMNGIRNEIYSLATKKILEIPLNKHIFTLTAPTGTGKTLTSFSCALKLRNRVKANSYIPRIIYSLPFTSIIDQNYEEIRKTLKQLPDFTQNESVYLIKHHHLADLKYKLEDEEKPIDESLLLVEGWESEVIITTFIQLLHSIIGFKNRSLKKYHNIAGSIILLDEVQNIPIEYWPLVNKVLKLLSENLSCYIILLTATRPLIFNKTEAIPLLENNKKYFMQMDRITLTPMIEELNIEEFFIEFQKLYDKENSYLIVFNTIKSSIEFYNMLKENKFIKKENGFYLSTNIIPKERVNRINEIKKQLERKERIIVVSTQVIEAGINLDMDVVIRDIGPIDSIIQVAGRCNREMGKGKRGKVYIFNLTDTHGSYAKHVYGAIHPFVSLELLDSKSLKEPQFFDLITQYFDLLTQKKNQKASYDIWGAIKQFRFYHKNLKSVSDFKIIEEKFDYVNVFVEVNDNATRILTTYLANVIKEKDFRKRQNNYFSLRKEFNSYIISVPRNLTGGLNSIYESLYQLPYEQLQVYYDKNTGFKRTEEESLIF